MTFICLECGYEFDEPITWKESRGEFWGQPCYETLSGCPKCYGGYDEKRNLEEYEVEE